MSKGNRGATIIEFALVAFIFFLILWGIFEFGRAFYVYNSAQHLTRCMAREAVVLRPSQHDVAKQNCLINASWPFYKTTPTDLRGDFVIRYYFRDGSEMVYIDDNRASEVSYVEVTVAPAETDLQQLGLLRAWLGSGELALPPSRTTMPAESMGVGR